MSKVLFYLISSRGTQRYEMLSIPMRTLKKKQAMEDFLTAWAKKSNCWDSCNNHISYGYEMPSKTKRFILSSKSRWRDDCKERFLSRFLTKIQANKKLKDKASLEKWFSERGVNIVPKEYRVVEFQLDPKTL